MFESNSVTHLGHTFRDHLTFVVILKSDVLLGTHGGEAREPSRISGHVTRTSGVNQPHVL